MKAVDLRELSVKDLQERLEEIYENLYTIKNKLAYETGANIGQYRTLKKDLARTKTVLREKQGAAE